MNGIWIWIKEAMQRLQVESPKFFISLRWGCLVLFILLSGLVLVNGVYPFGLEKIIFGTVTWKILIVNIATGLSFVFGFSYLPTKDKLPLPADAPKPPTQQ